MKPAKKNSSTQSANRDKFYWGLAFVLLALGIWGNIAYQDLGFSIRLALDLILLALLIGVLLPTRLVSGWRGYLMQAWSELHRVTWPSQSETKSVTLMVVVVVVIVSLLLWLLDSGLMFVVKLFV